MVMVSADDPSINTKGAFGSAPGVAYTFTNQTATWTLAPDVEEPGGAEITNFSPLLILGGPAPKIPLAAVRLLHMDG